MNSGTKQRSIDQCFVLPGQRSELWWQSEDDMNINIGRGQKFTAPGLDPAFAGIRLTLRVRTMAATAIRDANVGGLDNFMAGLGSSQQAAMQIEHCLKAGDTVRNVCCRRLSLSSVACNQFRSDSHHSRKPFFGCLPDVRSQHIV
jgi:hypothetical protein